MHGHDHASHPTAETIEEDASTRLRAGLVSLVVGSGLLVAKFTAYRITGSTAVFSDALESIINVAAALFALGGLIFAGRPADRGHPYGHGKIEFFSAVFEGGLITFAAILILYESVVVLISGDYAPRSLDVGLAILVGAGLANLALGLFLVRTGQKTQSITLIADGKHVISDFWTSLGVVVGLILVHVTGLAWLDPIIAAIVGCGLALTGFRLVRHAAGGLLDEEDSALLERLIAAMNENPRSGIIRIHNLRAIRAGRFTHVDAHLVVPEFWQVSEAHAAADHFERTVIEACGLKGEINFHTDPCHRSYCAVCAIETCPVRVAPFAGRTDLTTDEAVQPDPPLAN